MRLFSLPAILALGGSRLRLLAPRRVAPLSRTRSSRLNRSSLGLFALAAAVAAGACAPALGAEQTRVGIRIHYSRLSVTDVVVPANVPVTYTLVNDDPIDHEWLIGDAAFHERHRHGTEAAHGDLPNEVSLPPLSTRTTTLTLAPGTWVFVCHFPGHEAYGMVGTVTAR